MIKKLEHLAKPFRSLHQRTASFLLGFLLLGDLAFFILHTIRPFTPALSSPLFHLETDHGYPEIYQYLKLFAVVAILVFLSVRRAAPHYLAWASLFAYFLLDDSLMLHELLGQEIANQLELEPLLGLRPQDYGELVVSGVAGMILLVPLLWAYMAGSVNFRKMSQDFLILILLLIFFGVVVDMAHVVLHGGRFFNYVMRMTEDGGEMVTISLMLWYAFLKTGEDADSSRYIVDCVRPSLRRQQPRPVA